VDALRDSAEQLADVGRQRRRSVDGRGANVERSGGDERVAYLGQENELPRALALRVR
jgi:hypothetical protein